MNLRWLKWVRVVVAVVILCVSLLAFLNFRHVLPHGTSKVLASIQFVPATVAFAVGTGVALTTAVILVVTLAAGRIYCSAICPLGILQDVLARMGNVLRRGRSHFLRFAPAWTKWRYSVLALTLLSVPLGGAGLMVAWLDPYSHFGRIVSVLLRPVVFYGNNLLASLAEKWEWSGIYHVNILTAPAAVLATVGAFFLVLAAMSIWRGRLYCNTICPVGTLLGLLSKRALLRLRIDPDTCGKCADCVRSCKAQCIDLKSGAVDASRCVSCYNCMTVCSRSAMRLEPAWFSSDARKSPNSEPPFDPGRRQFLLTAASGALIAGASVLPAMADPHQKEKDGGHHGRKRLGITPPLAGKVETFLERCTACQLCVSACMTGVLQPSFLEYGPWHLLKPHMDYRHAFCNYNCTRCTEICPSGALTPLPLPQKRITQIGVAHFRKPHCIVYRDHTDCGACSEHCPTKAVHMVPFENGLVIPEVDESLCIGCGACEYACPVKEKAIIVSGLTEHAQARSPSSAQDLKTNVPKDGFPF
jgi:ferredoxin-type protein NapF